MQLQEGRIQCSANGGTYVYASGCTYADASFQLIVDIGVNHATSVQICAEMCVVNNVCSYFSFDPIRKVCYLHKNLNYPISVNPANLIDTKYGLCGYVTAH